MTRAVHTWVGRSATTALLTLAASLGAAWAETVVFELEAPFAHLDDFIPAKQDVAGGYRLGFGPNWHVLSPVAGELVAGGAKAKQSRIRKTGVFERGYSLRPNAETGIGFAEYRIPKQVQLFAGYCGVNYYPQKPQGAGSATIRILVDGQEAWRSPVMCAGSLVE